MARYSRLPSLAGKLTLANILVSATAVALAVAAFGAYDRSTARATLLQQLSIQAQIAANNSVSALLFNDAHTASETLSALSAAPNIVWAEIFGHDPQPFATFDRVGDNHHPTRLTIPSGQRETYRFDDDQIVLARQIAFQGKDVGAVTIASDYVELNSRRARYLGTGAAVLAALIVTAVFLSWLLQRSISDPIVSLARTATQVSLDRDYAVRATVKGNARELVVLTDAFNDMLAQIDQRDHALRDAQDELESRVQTRTAELDAVNKELEAFSYSVSHDLRAPLRHVVGFASLLEDRARENLDEQSRKYLRTITAAAEKMGNLIDDLLAFSRIGHGQVVKRRVNLSELVRDAQQEVVSQDLVQGREVTWHVGALPEVDADPALLRLVVVNLLSNALKYTAPREQTRIDVGVTESVSGEAGTSAGAINNGHPAGEVVVFVRDNGVGFDMQYAHKLFGVFQRLHTSEEFAGTGIGLANVKRIVHRHGGRVWAESELDQGATFYFTLPDKG